MHRAAFRWQTLWNRRATGTDRHFNPMRPSIAPLIGHHPRQKTSRFSRQRGSVASRHQNSPDDRGHLRWATQADPQRWSVRRAQQREYLHRCALSATDQPGATSYLQMVRYNVMHLIGCKSTVLRVTTVMPCTSAVAAMSASRSPHLSGTCNRARRCATAVSTGSVRPGRNIRTPQQAAVRWSHALAQTRYRHYQA